jgi:transposase InsO family protein
VEGVVCEVRVRAPEVTKDRRRGEVRVRLDDRQDHVALADLGADRSLMSLKLFLRLRQKKPRAYRLEKTSVRLQAYTKHPLETCGECEVSVGVGGKRLAYPFVVVAGDCLDDLILGGDFLNDFGAVLDMPKKKITFTYAGGVTVQMGSVGELTGKVTPLRAIATITVPALSERLCDVRVDQQPDEELTGGAVLPINEEDEGRREIVPAWGPLQLQGGVAAVALCNLTGVDVIVREGECVAMLSKEPEEYEFYAFEEGVGCEKGEEKKDVGLSADQAQVSAVQEGAGGQGQEKKEPVPPDKPPWDKTGLTVEQKKELVSEDTEELPGPMLGPTPRVEFKEADVKCPELSPAEKARVVNVIKQHLPVVTGELGRPRPKLEPFRIRLTDSKPVVAYAYRASTKEREVLKENVEQMVKAGVVRDSRSPWSSPVVMVRKKDGAIRFCVDYRKLNAVTERDVYPLPRIDDTLAALGGKRFFSSLDMWSAYWQIPVEEDSKKYTAFVCEFGLWEFNSLPFGLTNAPAAFQRIMDVVMAGLKFNTVLCYLDDIVVFSSTLEQHLKDLDVVLGRLEEYGLVLKLAKCTFASSKIHYLGHVVSREGVGPDPAKIAAVKDYPQPKTVKDVRSFLGFASYYRRFIKDFATVAAPLTAHLAGGHSARTPIEWNEASQKAFDTLREMLTTAPILLHPRWDREFILQTDASDVGIAAVLAQRDEQGREGVVAYISRMLAKAEVRWRVHEREALAVVWACETLRPYLAHNPFRLIVQTDHANLTYMFAATTPPRLARWAVRMAEFHYTMEYKKGVQNKADALSRAPLAVLAVGGAAHVPEGWAKEQEEDTVLGPLLAQMARDGGVTELRSKHAGEKGVYTRDRLGLLRYRPSTMPAEDGERLPLVVPLRKRAEVLRLMHDEPLMGHLGVKKTWRKMAQRFFWPGMRKDVKKYVSACLTCRQFKSVAPRRQGVLQPWVASKPFTVVHCDFIGPLRETRRRMKYVCVFVDRFTRWVEVAATATCDAETAGDCFIDCVVSRHGCPETVVTDRGTSFTARLYQRLVHRLGVRSLLVTAYNPQANAHVERVNRVLKAMMASAAKDRLEDWDLTLQAVVFAHRTAFMEQLRATPFELVYGRQARLPADVLLGAQEKLDEDVEVYKVKQTRRLLEAHKRAVVAQWAAKAEAERHADRKEVSFAPGQLALQWVGSIQPGEKQRWGVPKVKGPFRIERATRNPVVYELSTETQGRKVTWTVHVNKLIPYQPYLAPGSEQSGKAEVSQEASVQPMPRAATEGGQREQEAQQRTAEAARGGSSRAGRGAGEERQQKSERVPALLDLMLRRQKNAAKTVLAVRERKVGRDGRVRYLCSWQEGGESWELASDLSAQVIAMWRPELDVIELD